MSITRTASMSVLSLVAAGAIGGGFVLAMGHGSNPAPVELRQVADTATVSPTSSPTVPATTTTVPATTTTTAQPTKTRRPVEPAPASTTAATPAAAPVQPAPEPVAPKPVTEQPAPVAPAPVTSMPRPKPIEEGTAPQVLGTPSPTK